MYNRSMTENDKEIKYKKDGKGIAVLSNVVGIILIVLVIALMLPTFLPRILGYKTYNVVSGSMEPELPVGCLVLVKSVDPEEVRVGDVIVFRRGSSAVTHRVVEILSEDRLFVTKGDANESRDMNPVPYQDLVGRVTHHYAGLGTLMGFLSSVPGKILLIGMVVAGVVLQFLASKLRS